LRGPACTLGNIIAEWIHFAAPFTIAEVAMFGAWSIDFACAFAIGIVFQYFTIVPMRKLPFGKGLVQVDMYGWMSIVRFGIFGAELPKTNPTFWFMMQIAMGFGFLTSYPVNWWLVKEGIKEKM
jgi:hypothetical protein